MKRIVLITLIALGLAQSSRAAALGNLFWAPSDANWNTTTANWYDTNLLGNVLFTDRDSVIIDDTGAAVTAVTLVGLLSPSNVLVDASLDYSLTTDGTGKLTNVFSLTKKGGGKLTLDADCVITNNISVDAGTLQVGNGSSRGSLGTGLPGYTAPVNNSGTLAFNRTGTLTFSNNITGSGELRVVTTAGTINMRGNNTMTGSIVHNGAILNFLGSSTIGNPSGIQIVASAANARFQFSEGIDLNCPILITDASGGSTVRAAVQSMTGINSANGQILVGPGSGGALVQLIANNAGSQLTVNGSVADQDTGNRYSGPFYLRGGNGIGKLYGTITLPSANLIKDDAQTWTIYSSGNSAAVTLVQNGTLRLAATDALPNTRLELNTILDLGGFDQKVTQLWSVGAGATVGSSSATSDSILSITGTGGAYGGVFQDSISGGTRKIGLKILTGAQQFTSSCTYSGPTTILAGGLILSGSGSIPNTTPIDIADGANLIPSLRTDGTFTLGASQTLKGSGNFNIKGNFSSQGTVELKANKTGGVTSTDTLNVIADNGWPGQMTFGGTLKLDLSGDPLSSTDVLPLFTANSYTSGSGFTTIIPTTPGAGLAWNTNYLTTDGTLHIDSTAPPIPTAPTNITFAVVSGGTELEVAWPETYKGWTLQGQTNALNVGITTSWSDVPASAATNRVFLPIDPANGSVFYRLYYQQP